MNLSDKVELLETIKHDIISTNVTPDLARTANSLVMGDGNPNADIVFIGERSEERRVGKECRL